VPDTIPQSEAVLKDYFSSGKKPTPQQFRELIGTATYLFQQALLDGNAANQAAAFALSSSVQGSVKATFDGSNYNRAAGYINVEPITYVGNTVKVTWTTPFLDANYKVFVIPYTPTTPGHSNVRKIAQTTRYVQVEFWQENGSTAGKPEFHLVAFKKHGGEIAQYIITASAGLGGRINPSGIIVLSPGDAQGFIATPSATHTVNQWLVDGVAVQDGGNSYTLPSIDANHSVQVTFN
jgi:hypothetical protein